MTDPAPLPPSPTEKVAADLWNEVLQRLPSRDGRAASTTLGAAQAVAFENGELRLEVPSGFHRDRLTSRHLSTIQEVLAALNPAADVEIVVRAGEVVPPADQLTLQLDEPEPAPALTGGEPLDPRLTFAAFVVGESNSLAQGAALSVAENTSDAYNPLYIHGESGNGKTHLLNAIGLHVRENAPRRRRQYVTIDHFTSEFIEGIRGNRLDAFKRRYRACDLLLVDDVQFLEGKEATQEEFFHTFNEVTRRGGRVVLTADCRPGDIPKLPDRLLSRFRGGLVADLAAPEFELRVAILASKAQAKGVAVTEDVLAYLASQLTRNVRELEGAFTLVLADAGQKRRPVTLDGARLSVEKLLGSAGRDVSLARVITEAAETFGIAVEELCSPTRARQVVIARQVAMYVCRILTDESLPAIGRAFGGRDHTTVLHAFRKIEKLMTTSAPVHVKVVELTNRLGGAPPRPG